MRLEVLKSGHRPLQKLQLKVIAALVGQVPGPIAVMSYRRRIFGRWFSQCLWQAMKKATEWSQKETELFAMVVSDQNRCRY
jgi:hypothetical protein